MSNKQKEIEKVERRLRPTEWAALLADEGRAYRSSQVYVKAILEKTFWELPWSRAYFALKEQANELHSGKTPEEIRLRNELRLKNATDFAFLTTLQMKVNEHIEGKMGELHWRAESMSSWLYCFQLEDKLEHLAKWAAFWVRHCKSTGAAEENRHLLLILLNSYETGNTAEGRSFRVRFSSLIERWAGDAKRLMLYAYAHRYAVRTVEKNWFDDHRILFCDIEAKLEAASKTLEEASANFNEWMKVKSGFLNGERIEEDQEAWRTSTTTGEQQSLDIGVLQDQARRTLVGCPTDNVSTRMGI